MGEKSRFMAQDLLPIALLRKRKGAMLKQKEKNMKPKKSFNSSDILYYALSGGKYNAYQIYKILANGENERDQETESDFLELLKLLKKEGLIIY